MSQVYIDLRCRSCRFLAIKTMYERIYEACLPEDRKYRTVHVRVRTSLSFPFLDRCFSFFEIRVQEMVTPEKDPYTYMYTCI